MSLLMDISERLADDGCLGKVWRSAALLCLSILSMQHVSGALLMEEGFNYPSASYLGTNLPWAGNSGSSIRILSGSLTLTALRGTAPIGNMLQIGGGTTRSDYRNFNSAPVTAGAVYFSVLFKCTLLPTNSQFIASLMMAGNFSPSPPDDPLDLYVTPATGGYKLRIGHTGNDPVTGITTLAINTTHLIVMKYAYGSGGQASVYVDPTPGGAEPATTEARTELGEGTDTSNLQIVLLHAPSLATQGMFNLDSLRIGTAWADVTPPPSTVSVAGPADQAACYGSVVSFSVVPTGTPPYTYYWRTNGIPVPAATNSTYTLAGAGASDALNIYDVIVNDASGSITSRVAKLTFSTNAPSFVSMPVAQVILPGVSNVTFSTIVAGDAPLSYQWRTNGSAIPSATNNSYTVVKPGPPDALNLFDVVATNPCGSITSSPSVSVIFLNVFYPAFDAGPGFFSGENLILTNGAALGLGVWSSSNPIMPVSNWSLEGQMQEQPLNDGTGQSRYSINVTPATSPVYYIFAHANQGPYLSTEPLVWLTTPDGGFTYEVFTTNMPVSADGVFGFASPPIITQQPADCRVAVGHNASFSVIASGSDPLSYQWYYNSNTPLPNGTNAVLLLTAASAGDAGTYSVIVTNASGSATSSVALLTVELPPVILSLPASITAIEGTAVSFNVSASGTGPLAYQWQLGGVNLPGATNNIFTLPNVQTTNAGVYSIIVTNFGGTTSGSILLTVVTSLGMTQQGNFIVLTWNGSWMLQTATNVTGTYEDLPGAISPFTNRVNLEPSRFYRLRSTATNGLVSLGFSGGNFLMNGSGVPGYNYVVEASTNLLNWGSLQTNPAPFQFIDAHATNYSRRFYRTRLTY